MIKLCYDKFTPAKNILKGMTDMKIGTCVGFYKIEEMEEKLKNLHENGFDNCQLLSWDASVRTAENLPILKGLFEKYGITISAFWCGWDGPGVWNLYEGQKTLGLVPREYREMRVGNLIEGADYAKALGVTDVITHMGFIPENPYDPEFIPFCDAVRKVAEHLKANGQYLLFETGQETPNTMLRCFETVGCDNLGINLDTANLILYGRANPADALEIFGSYVRNLHAKDGLYPTNGHDLGKEVKIGQGRVDFEKVFTRLHELGYDGYVTIEREIAGEQQNIDVLEARDYLQNIIDRIYGTN